jgi:hypothetical protein
LKHDGFRALAYIDAGECRLVSRNLKSLRFESLTLALGKLPVKNAIIDGEIVCLDGKGVSQFNALLTPKGRDAAAFRGTLFLLQCHGTRRFWRREGIITQPRLLMKFDDDCSYVLLSSYNVFQSAELFPLGSWPVISIGIL